MENPAIHGNPYHPWIVGIHEWNATSIYMMRSANMVTLHGGKLMSNARKEHQVLVLQQMIMRER